MKPVKKEKAIQGTKAQRVRKRDDALNLAGPSRPRKRDEANDELRHGRVAPWFWPNRRLRQSAITG